MNHQTLVPRLPLQSLTSSPYNPETVSTDFDEADRLYFENVS